MSATSEQRYRPKLSQVQRDQAFSELYPVKNAELQKFCFGMLERELDAVCKKYSGLLLTVEQTNTIRHSLTCAVREWRLKYQHHGYGIRGWLALCDVTAQFERDAMEITYNQELRLLADGSAPVTFWEPCIEAIEAAWELKQAEIKIATLRLSRGNNGLA